MSQKYKCDPVDWTEISRQMHKVTAQKYDSLSFLDFQQSMTTAALFSIAGSLETLAAKPGIHPGKVYADGEPIERGDVVYLNEGNELTLLRRKDL